MKSLLLLLFLCPGFCTISLTHSRGSPPCVPFRRVQCVEDWLEIYQIYRDNSEELVGRYCANSAPGPVVSLRELAVGLKVFLHTDAQDVYSGFLGRYRFFEETSVFGNGKHWIQSNPFFFLLVLNPIGRYMAFCWLLILSCLPSPM